METITSHFGSWSTYKATLERNGQVSVIFAPSSYFGFVLPDHIEMGTKQVQASITFVMNKMADTLLEVSKNAEACVPPKHVIDDPDMLLNVGKQDMLIKNPHKGKIQGFIDNMNKKLAVGKKLQDAGVALNEGFKQSHKTCMARKRFLKTCFMLEYCIAKIRKLNMDASDIILGATGAQLLLEIESRKVAVPEYLVELLTTMKSKLPAGAPPIKTEPVDDSSAAHAAALAHTATALCDGLA